jgi:hypothetical protein
MNQCVHTYRKNQHLKIDSKSAYWSGNIEKKVIFKSWFFCAQWFNPTQVLQSLANLESYWPKIRIQPSGIRQSNMEYGINRINIQ